MAITNGHKTKIIRLIRDWDQFELARRAGVERTTISEFERDIRNTPKTLCRIEAAFGFHLNDPEINVAFFILANDYARSDAVRAALAILEESSNE